MRYSQIACVLKCSHPFKLISKFCLFSLIIKQKRNIPKCEINKCAECQISKQDKAAAGEAVETQAESKPLGGHQAEKHQQANQDRTEALLKPERV